MLTFSPLKLREAGFLDQGKRIRQVYFMRIFKIERPETVFKICNWEEVWKEATLRLVKFWNWRVTPGMGQRFGWSNTITGEKGHQTLNSEALIVWSGRGPWVGKHPQWESAYSSWIWKPEERALIGRTPGVGERLEWENVWSGRAPWLV